MQQYKSKRGTLTGKQKAAILMVTLGPELSANIYKHLREEEIEDLTLEIANIKRVEPQVRDEVLVEFKDIAKAQEYISTGGIEYARELLEKALGTGKAEEIIRRLTSSLQVRPFDFARRAEPAQLFNFIQGEHPQTISLIMAYLQPEQAAAILSSLSAEEQIEVAKRLATMDGTSPEVLSDVESVLEKRLASFINQESTSAGGLQSIVEILNRVDRSTEKTIMDGLDGLDPDLAENIRKRMFVFEDVAGLDDRAIQRVIREVESKDWALSLKGSNDIVQEKIFKNMSQRAASMLKEEIDYLGPVRLRDVEEAQQRIVAIIRKLEDAGEIVISRGGEDEIIV
ncbi:MAG: flagellar motor switch protein FliG [Firmicutes bacterium]|nr:flagellar motor switch protein FliG [Bacillota bacterium]MDD4694485.1 flagellar motor switch protein FliG [Bacillota bacterium]